MYRSIILICLLLLPGSTFAAVTINEVAWMGDIVSPNNEWIELYNAGANATDITDWTLTDGNNLNLTLAGTIGAGEYVVLERNRSSGLYLMTPPFLTYAGALVNTGATLTLRRTDDSIEDQIVGGIDWQFGTDVMVGNNTTKDTAQYSTSGWITAAPTPGRPNATVATPIVVPETGTNTTTTISRSGGGGTAVRGSQSETVRLTLPDVTLKLALDIQTTAYVNQSIPLRVTASGIGETLLDSLQYSWNFGDLATSSSKDTTHTYRYPGTYVVTLYASFGRQYQIARHEITVLPVTFSLTHNSAGDIQIHNDAPYEVDLSGYQIVGDSPVAFPPRTILLPRSSITIPHQRLVTAPNRAVALYDGKSTLVASSLAPVRQLFAPSPVTSVTTLAAAQSSSVSVATRAASRSLEPAPLAASTPPEVAPDVPLSTTPDSAFQFANQNLVLLPPATTALPLAYGVATTTPEVTAALAFRTASDTIPATPLYPSPLRTYWPYLALIVLIAGTIVSLIVTKKPVI